MISPLGQATPIWTPSVSYTPPAPFTEPMHSPASSYTGRLPVTTRPWALLTGFRSAVWNIAPPRSGDNPDVPPCGEPGPRADVSTPMGHSSQPRRLGEHPPVLGRSRAPRHLIGVGAPRVEHALPATDD